MADVHAARSTVEVDRALVREVKILAIEKNMKLKDVVDQALREWISRSRKVGNGRR